MNDAGYIYALINPSMEGLVKVGKTTRYPDERAAELSQATGVPTPFIVAYQLSVISCSKAEEFVHAFLEEKGVRLSSNREFFNASLTDVINSMIQAKMQTDKLNVNEINHTYKYDEDAINIESNFKPWQEIEEQGHAYRIGSGEVLEDQSKAIECYEKAVKLGSPTACAILGSIYHYNAEKADFEKAIRYYEEGVKRSNYQCYALMMSIYFDMCKFDNAQKCWCNFMGRVSKDSDFDLSSYLRYCYLYLEKTFEFQEDIYYINELVNYREKIIKYAEDELNSWKEWCWDKEKVYFRERLNEYIKLVLMKT